jgi:hypothetical protein
MITIDSISSGTNAGQGTITVAHTVGNGNKRELIVCVAFGNNAAQSVSGITYNGVALTRLRADFGTPSGAYWRTEVWSLENPPVGTANIVVSLSGAVSGLGTAGISLFGSQGVLDASATGNAVVSPLQTSITPSTPVLLIDAMAVERAGSASVNAGQTQRVNADTTSRIKFGVSTKINTARTADTVGWSFSGAGANGILNTVVALRAASSKGASII